ncbi:MAG: ATP-binding protein, partial [Elusimicrobia bacterium]|nr:ATP-binding protein [Elusimicrobiota bacterium]
APAPAPEPAPTPAPTPAPAAAPPPVEAVTVSVGQVEPGPIAPLRADWTFETLLVGAYNRFAHAAAMSVVSSPGTMYNPLFLYGVPGTGKSHLLQAIGAALSKGLGVGVANTSGPRLSRAVNSALARKDMREIDALIADSKTLLVDDVHLTAVSDANKAVLAKIFKAFFDRQQQVVLTSLYPPRALGALEEALKFSFSKGWSVDLKLPSASVQKDLIASAADRSQAGLASEEIALLHEKLSQWGYQDLTLWLHRVAVFKRTREAAKQSAGLADLIPLIYDPVVAGSAEPIKPATTSFRPPAAGAGAPPLAVIAPKGQDGVGPYAASLFYEIGAKNGLTEPYRHALWETYDPAQTYGVPFVIGDLCARARVARALVVGPPPDSPLGARAAELAHAVRRILDSQGVLAAWIPYNGLQQGAHYLNAHLDLLELPPKAAS